ncbi:uncharacterized protein FOMMEDRAFT_159751 [Fomitiporia mediterranea MF3/22]|uniref:uncharacterized protein n=1 Tax=Fomitiporia mediterranea (strain MF3/22) TaxID=694068 RepID=UPI0004407CB2|nr:uncharacterized protein FOMMEDRAFT_159751 [Fomitiporia mediterranea MF3/22]EJD00119.1 hypothetical protein FOMMEDRAFT_159751 [Fomitiporia mediterranea MF3/22]
MLFIQGIACFDLLTYTSIFSYIASDDGLLNWAHGMRSPRPDMIKSQRSKKDLVSIPRRAPRETSWPSESDNTNPYSRRPETTFKFVLDSSVTFDDSSFNLAFVAELNVHLSYTRTQVFRTPGRRVRQPRAAPLPYSWVYGVQIKTKDWHRISKDFNWPWEEDPMLCECAIMDWVIQETGILFKFRTVKYRDKTAEIVTFVFDNERRMDGSRYKQEQMDAVAYFSHPGPESHGPFLVSSNWPHVVTLAFH